MRTGDVAFREEKLGLERDAIPFQSGALTYLLGCWIDPQEAHAHS